MGVAYCLVTPYVAGYLAGTPGIAVDVITNFGGGLCHVTVRGPSVPDTGSWCKQVVLDDGTVRFKDDADTGYSDWTPPEGVKP